MRRAVAALLHLVVRRPGAVDQHGVAEHAVAEVVDHTVGCHQIRIARGIQQLARRTERSVADEERELSVTAGQAQCRLLLVAVKVHSDQAQPHLRAAEVHAVVVVPERRGPLVERVVVGELALVNGPDHVQVVVPPRRWQHVVERVAVRRRRRQRAVQVAHDGHGQVVAHPDAGAASAGGFEEGARELAVVPPDPRGVAAHDFGLARAHGHLVNIATGADPDRFERCRYYQRTGERLRELALAEQSGPGLGELRLPNKWARTQGYRRCWGDRGRRARLERARRRPLVVRA